MYTNNYSKYLIKITPSSKLLNNSDQNYDGKTWRVYVKKKIKVTLNNLSTNGLWFIPLFSLKVKKKIIIILFRG